MMQSNDKSRLRQQTTTTTTTTTNIRNKIDFCQMSAFKQFKSPFYCVISNDECDFICHTIFIMATSDYFRGMLDQTEDEYEYGEIKNGIDYRRKIPRIYVKRFDSHSLESFIKFAYMLRLDHIDSIMMKKLLEFSSYINCIEMMNYLEMKSKEFNLH
ncbi:hypothetical protein DERF_005124 [Dermatophagoides farinae]|uniref:BTB domain-containing protein n=2 Tax=Dermatophagoides farinae TaxID=6954 RepID=A0A922I6A7_DERFA|nr:uncharacterized protein LOC124494711 [Dermatophagoides farinae]KAH9521466.1 hypothetical protein DERF_005124 [Dermatophagoides farinae]